MIKRTPADDWFSKCVRMRSNFTCDHCGTVFPGLTRELHCSHFEGRSNHSIRFDIDNGFAHCASCHKHLASHPGEFTRSVERLIGSGRVDMVLQKKHDTSLGRMAKRGIKDGSIAEHYRNEFRRMEKMRTGGIIERIEFENWA